MKKIIIALIFLSITNCKQEDLSTSYFIQNNSLVGLKVTFYKANTSRYQLMLNPNQKEFITKINRNNDSDPFSTDSVKIEFVDGKIKVDRNCSLSYLTQTQRNLCLLDTISVYKYGRYTTTNGNSNLFIIDNSDYLEAR